MRRNLAVGALALLAGVAVAMNHETDALIELDKEWGAAATGQAAADAIERVVAEDALVISPAGLGSRVEMIEEAMADDSEAVPYVADNYEVKFLTEDVAVMVHHAGEPDPHWSLHVWQKLGDEWKVVASSSAPESDE